MSTVDNEVQIFDATFEEFTREILGLYSGPQVTIRVATSEYLLSKALLCRQSPYFTAAFEGEFKENDEKLLELNKEDDIVSPRSFELLIQWMHVGRINFGELKTEEAITAALELAKTADMCAVAGVESLIAQRIKEIILTMPPERSVFTPSETNYRCLMKSHIKVAALLPRGHQVRRIIARATVAGCLTGDSFGLIEEIENFPDFAVDTLGELRATLKTLRVEKRGMGFNDPFSEQRVRLKEGELTF